MGIQPIPASREEWLKLREPFVGASEVCALLGIQAAFHQSAYELWAVKSGKAPRKDADTDRTRSGIAFEEGVAQFTAEKRNWILSPGVFAVDDETDGLCATLDRLVLPTPEDEAAGYTGPGALECKYVEFQSEIWDLWEGGEPPLYYMIQLQAQMACANLQWGAVGARVGSTHIIKTYPRHDEVIAKIREAVDDFWNRVAFGTPPKPDQYEGTGRVLRAMFPRPMPKTIVDLRGDNQLPGLCIEKKKLEKQRNAIKKREDEIANIIREKIEANEKALIADGISVSRSVGEDTPDREAEPGEIIPGRKGQDRLTINVTKELLAA